ncbi:MAG TPA: type II secretion system F family protein [Planctomycetota bacterium]
MPQYDYKAKTNDGAVVSGTLQAESERSALDSLGRMGVFPLEIAAQDERPAQAAPAPRRGGGRVKIADVALFTRQLGDLLKAGVPLNRALATLREQTSSGALSEIIESVGKDVSSGGSLHESLGKHPKAFSSLFTSMVRAGETGGFLEDVLRRLSIFIERDQELRSRVKSALAYPTLLIVIGTGAIAFLMVFFIPRFSEIFARMGDSLPVPTQIVMAASSFVRHWWFLIFLGVAGGLAAVNQLAATGAGRRILDRLRLRIPVFGDIVRKNAISRFTRTLGTLLKSGVSILGALAIAKEAMGNAVLEEDVVEAAAGVKQGKSLAEVLRTSRAFPPMVVQMIAVGEEGGNLDEVLVDVAESYDTQVERAVRVFISLFEPALLVFMAALVGFVVIAMLLPVFSLSSMIK